MFQPVGLVVPKTIWPLGWGQSGHVDPGLQTHGFSQISVGFSARKPNKPHPIESANDRRLKALQTLLRAPLGYHWNPPPELLEEAVVSSEKVIHPFSARYRPVFRTNPILPNVSRAYAQQLAQFNLPTLERTGEVSLLIPTISGSRMRYEIKPGSRLKDRLGDPTVQADLGESRTDFVDSYNVRWSSMDCARDALQNFYDGHGHTLEGVRFTIQLTSNPKAPYRIKITGLAEYPYNAVKDIGGGDKLNDYASAGYFGEGAKIMSLVMLKAHAASRVTFHSADWQLSYGFKDEGLKKRMVRQLSLQPYEAGNSLEIETQSLELVESFLKTPAMFYHPLNPDFGMPEYDGKMWGFQLLGPNAQGNFYHCGQRFQIKNWYREPENAWDRNLDGLHLWTRFRSSGSEQNPTIGRDRQPLSIYDIASLLKQVLQEPPPGLQSEPERQEELVRALVTLEPYWSADDLNQGQAEGGFEKKSFNPIIEALVETAQSMRMAWVFPPEKKLVALQKSYERTQVSDHVLQKLRDRGYKLCHPAFAQIGMPTVLDAYKTLGLFTALAPTPVEVEKLHILRLMAYGFSDIKTPLLTPPHQQHILFRPRDIQVPIYVFDRHIEKDQHQVFAKCRLQNNTDLSHPAPWEIKQVWIDRAFLNQATFHEALAAYLHELNHQYGGDDDPAFGYHLTDTMAGMSRLLLEHPKIYQRMRDLNRLWEERTPKRQP